MRKRKLTEEEKLRRLSPRKKLALVNAWCKAKYGATSRWKYKLKFFNEKQAWTCCLKDATSERIKELLCIDPSNARYLCKSKTRAFDGLIGYGQAEGFLPSLLEMQLFLEVTGQ